MPELPEVEAARRRLRSWLVGGTVVRASHRRLVGRRIVAVGRRGKWLRIDLGGDLLVFSHLGMTGKWLRRGASEARAVWERARVDVARGGEIVSARYVDPRKLGRFVVAQGDIAAWSKVGPDALDGGLDAPAFGARLARSGRPVKVALMDQAVVAGIGNIVATEALWRARVSPWAPADTLSPAEVRTLARALAAVIRRSIAAQASGDVAYVHDAGGLNPFRVYGRAGRPCPRCGAALERRVLGGRGTVFCPACQKR